MLLGHVAQSESHDATNSGDAMRQQVVQALGYTTIPCDKHAGQIIVFPCDLYSERGHTRRQVAANQFVPATCRMKSNQFDFMRHVAGTTFCRRDMFQAHDTR